MTVAPVDNFNPLNKEKDEMQACLANDKSSLIQFETT